MAAGGAGSPPPAAALAPVIPLQHTDRPRPRSFATLDAAAILVAVVVALSPLWSGYYAFGAWAPITLGAVAVLVVVALRARPAFTTYGISSGGALAVLLALSAASMLWAESKENAWTASNQLALYGVVFAIGLLALRTRRSARTVALILGAPALLTAVLTVAKLLTGHGQGAFLDGRLDSPMGYINATAGMLVMGIWPWIALAETASGRAVRAAMLASAALIAGTAVLTQSRATVLAMVIATVLVLIAAPERTRRGANLALVAAAVALSLHWTLAVYPATGPTQSLALGDGVLRSAALALIASALLAGLAKLGLSAIAARLSPPARDRAIHRLGQTLLLATAVGVLAIAIGGGPTLKRQWITYTQNVANRSATNRFLSGGGFRYDLWRVAIDEFAHNPLGGLGAGNYDTQYFLLRRNPQAVIVPHSLELQMAAELGIVGLLALLTFCGSILAAGFARRRTLASSDRLIRIAGLGMFAAWLSATSVDWLYNFPGLTCGALLAGALLVVPDPAFAGRRVDRRNGGRVHRAALVVALGALALIAASVGRQYSASRYAVAGAAKVQTQPAAAIRTLQTAEQLDPYSLQTLYDIAAAYAALDDYPDARAALLAAEAREPDNYVPPALLGDLATRRGYDADALAAYRQALRLDPDDPEIQGLVQSTSAQVRATGGTR